MVLRSGREAIRAAAIGLEIRYVRTHETGAVIVQWLEDDEINLAWLDEAPAQSILLPRTVH